MPGRAGGAAHARTRGDHMPARATLRFRIRAENTGLMPWIADGEPATGKGAVQLGVDLLDDEGMTEVIWDYGRAALPRNVALGETILLDLSSEAPNRPGRYSVELDMVAEGLAWFEELGSAILRHPLYVDPPGRYRRLRGVQGMSAKVWSRMTSRAGRLRG